MDVPRSQRTRDQQIHRVMHRPVLTPAEPIAKHPSHLHIDILPRAQGVGFGVPMMTVLLDALRANGSPGVHLGVSHANKRAVSFYQHLGFVTLADFGEHGLLLGLTLQN
jgi:GNAT superfamily N-acetyltransferase